MSAPSPAKPLAGSDTCTIIGAIRKIAEHCEHLAAHAAEDADHWGHVIRASALREAACHMEEMHGQLGGDDVIEANADLALWCVHVLGPDDIIATASHAEAVALAGETNRAVLGRADRDGREDILCFAYAAPWQGDATSHAISIARSQQAAE